MGRRLPGGEALAAQLIVLNDDHLPRLQGAHVVEAEVQQRNTLAGRGEQWKEFYRPSCDQSLRPS